LNAIQDFHNIWTLKLNEGIYIKVRFGAFPSNELHVTSKSASTKVSDFEGLWMLASENESKEKNLQKILGTSLFLRNLPLSPLHPDQGEEDIMRRSKNTKSLKISMMGTEVSMEYRSCFGDGWNGTFDSRTSEAVDIFLKNGKYACKRLWWTEHKTSGDSQSLMIATRFENGRETVDQYTLSTDAKKLSHIFKIKSEMEANYSRSSKNDLQTTSIYHKVEETDGQIRNVLDEVNDLNIIPAVNENLQLFVDIHKLTKQLYQSIKNPKTKEHEVIYRHLSKEETERNAHKLNNLVIPYSNYLKLQDWVSRSTTTSLLGKYRTLRVVFYKRGNLGHEEGLGPEDLKGEAIISFFWAKVDSVVGLDCSIPVVHRGKNETAGTIQIGLSKVPVRNIYELQSIRDSNNRTRKTYRLVEEWSPDIISHARTFDGFKNMGDVNISANQRNRRRNYNDAKERLNERNKKLVDKKEQHVEWFEGRHDRQWERKSGPGGDHKRVISEVVYSDVSLPSPGSPSPRSRTAVSRTGVSRTGVSRTVKRSVTYKSSKTYNTYSNRLDRGGS